MEKTGSLTGTKLLLILLANLAVTFWCGDRAGSGCAFAEQIAADAGSPMEGGADAAQHRTLLAGEAGQATFMGRTVLIPGVNRGHMTSITLGGSLLEPEQGDTLGLPIAALYLRRVWQDSRTRDMISIFANDLEYDKSFGHVELVSRFENYTLPGDFTEVVDGHEIKPTSLKWGTLAAALGPGLRFPVAPYQVDNNARLQFLGVVGYFYAKKTSDTGPSLVVPPDTLLYGVKLRGRYDEMRRNLLELPHRGFAAGWDLDYLHRDKWRELEPASTGSGNRDYLQVTGYFVGACGIPGLSERDRLLITAYGGKTGQGSADRFNAFRINGGPFPGEEEDLARPHYTGIIYDGVLATSYATASLSYRRELAFFLYLSVVGSYIWAERATVQGVDQVVFRDRTGAAGTVSLDSGFLWNSSLYLAYTLENGFIRGGKSGHGLILTWNKLF